MTGLYGVHIPNNKIKRLGYIYDSSIKRINPLPIILGVVGGVLGLLLIVFMCKYCDCKESPPRQQQVSVAMVPVAVQQVQVPVA